MGNQRAWYASQLETICEKIVNIKNDDFIYNHLRTYANNKGMVMLLWWLVSCMDITVTS